MYHLDFDVIQAPVQFKWAYLSNEYMKYVDVT